ncbi:MAG: chromosomal replication initiator protein DnaA [Opitutae bacterium]|jgi:chromosomal replication initiator protein|nr:chromosomal replication initiator protein DnaA [Opitutae bacterium]
MSDIDYAQGLWEKVCEELKRIFPSDVYEMWFSDIVCESFNEDILTLKVPNDFNAIWIENNYLDFIKQHACFISGSPISVRLEIIEATKENPIVEDIPAQKANHYRNRLKEDRISPQLPSELKPTFLNPKNTFENFVIGSGNQLAHAACIAVANAPGRAYNPLFVYGATGLGKTHLMHAVSHQILNSKPDAKIAYLSTEKFTNEFIHAIRENKLAKFRKRYRTVDALLIDDIHFLSGKDSTQEEFFHTFNDLFESGKQIIIASDRPANEIDRLENRLVSRFQWGLVTDIQPPDFETRLAILSNKASAMNLEISDEILYFLAERVSRNVRRMEGALTRIISYDALIDRKLDLASVENLLSDLLQDEVAAEISIDQIQKKVAEYHQISYSDMLGRKRTNKIAFPRQVAMYLTRTLTNIPLKSIGDAFGGRDHGTVIHACKQVENMMDQDGTIKRSVDYLSNVISKNNS